MKKTEFFAERKGMHIYPWYISDITSAKEMKAVFGEGIKRIFISIEKGFLRGYYDMDSAATLGKLLLNRITSDKSFFEDVIKNIYTKGDELNIFCEKLKNITDISLLSNTELVSIYDEYVRTLCSLRVWGWVPVFIDGFKVSFLTDHVLSEFEKFLTPKGLNNKLSEYYSILSSSDKPSEIHSESIDRLRVSIAINQSPAKDDIIELISTGNVSELKNRFDVIYGQLEDHRKKYEWLTYAYSGPLMSIEYLLKVIAEDFTKKQSVEEQYEEAINRHKEIATEKKFATEELQLDEHMLYLFRVSSELMYMKDWRKGVYQKSYVVMDKVITEIARRMNLTLDECKYIIIDEIKDALLNNNLESVRSKAKSRTDLCCYEVTENKMEIWEGEECKIKISEIVSDVPKKEDEKDTIIRGLIAYKGHVTGPAKIILVESDMVKLVEGDVLVSSATNPDLILAMKKASAFVTDMGGITSHAAIVAREMKKPCIVGTGKATRLIRDGDIVEVNANDGIVSIIKRI